MRPTRVPPRGRLVPPPTAVPQPERPTASMDPAAYFPVGWLAGETREDAGQWGLISAV